MSYEVKITNMYMGQGLGCTIEVMDTLDDPKTEFLAIYDFGSSSGNIAPAMAYAKNCILNRTPNGAAAPLIDAIYVSHLDEDHYNCLAALADSIQYPSAQFPVKPNVGTFFVGGIENVHQLPPDFQNALARFNIIQTINIPTGYKHAGNNPYIAVTPPFVQIPPTLIWDFLEYQLRLIPLLYRADLLFAHHRPAWAFTGTDILINAGSIVLLATVVNTSQAAAANPFCFSALFTGDATMGTLAEFLNANAVPLTQQIQGNFVFAGEYKFVTVPHHGAERTVRDINDSTAPTFNALNSFLRNYSPHSTMVSALSSNWGHPRESVLARFWEATTMGAQVPGAYPPMNPAPPLNPQHYQLAYRARATPVITQCDRHLYTSYFVNQHGVECARGFTTTFSDANTIDISELL